MGRGKAVAGVILILLGEFLIYLYIYPLFIFNVMQALVPSIFLMELANSMAYLVYIFLIGGIVAIIAGIYYIVRSKFPPKKASSGDYYYPG